MSSYNFTGSATLEIDQIRSSNLFVLYVESNVQLTMPSRVVIEAATSDRILEFNLINVSSSCCTEIIAGAGQTTTGDMMVAQSSTGYFRLVFENDGSCVLKRLELGAPMEVLN